MKATDQLNDFAGSLIQEVARSGVDVSSSSGPPPLVSSSIGPTASGSFNVALGRLQNEPAFVNRFGLLGRCLGTGAFGRVVLGRALDNGRPIACKPVVSERLIKEEAGWAAALMQMNHANVCNCVDVF